MWISGPTEGLENIFLLLQSTSNPDKRVYARYTGKISFRQRKEKYSLVIQTKAYVKRILWAPCRGLVGTETQG